ncbi:MAG: hypothetical protein ACLQVM_31175 [Terriglobia bacterium]
MRYLASWVLVIVGILLLVVGLMATLLGLAWRRWYLDLPHVKEPKWRRVTSLAGLEAGSVNALLFYGWLWYGWSHSIRSIYPILAEEIGAGLCVFVILTEIVKTRGACVARLTPLAAAGFLGVLGWACAFAFTLVD